MRKNPIQSAIYRTQPGVVSLLTVMFFIVLVAVLSLGFLRLSITEQSQTLNDDLSRSALAAARSGTELAKKYLLDCRRGDAAACVAVENASSCPGLVNAANSQVSASEFEQKIACLLVDLDPPTIVGKTNPGNTGDLYPLRSPLMTRGVTMTLKWHSPLTDEDGPVSSASLGGLPGVTDNPAFGSWPTDRPGVMRITFFTFIPGNSAATNESLGTVYLKLSASGGGAPVVMDTGNKFINTAARCVNSTTDYICSKQIVLNHLPAVMPAGGLVYAHIATEYRSAFYELSGESGGSPVLFSNVQPEIDSTGITSDTIRRLKSRVSYGDTGFFPRDAASAGQGICKDMFVSAVEDLTNFEDCP